MRYWAGNDTGYYAVVVLSNVASTDNQSHLHYAYDLRQACSFVLFCPIAAHFVSVP